MSDELHRDLIVFDGLIVSKWSRAVFEDMQRGGVSAANCTCAIWEGFQGTMDNIALWKRWFADYDDILLPVHTTADINRAKRAGKVGIVLGWQNITPIEDRIDYLALFKALGVGIGQLAYNTQNLVGTGCYESHDGGLSDYGRDVIDEMNRVGMLVDLSHVGAKTSEDAIRHSQKPVCYSHALPEALRAHPRNKTDEQIRFIAESGGFIGVTMFPAFLPRGADSTLDDYLDAIDDVVQRIGPDHVGFGIDFTQDQPPSFWHYIGSQQGTSYPAIFQDPNVHWEQVKLYPDDLETPDELPNLAGGLQRRGYSDAEISGILGGNWLRLFGQVWKD